jgi:hypothetical protein
MPVNDLSVDITRRKRVAGAMLASWRKEREEPKRQETGKEQIWP